MDILLTNKLNRLLASWPDGSLRTAIWFRKHNYSRQLIRRYCQYGWIKNIGHGVYVKLGDSVEWSGALHALQEQLGFPVHLGGASALELFGLYQYIAMRDNKPYLFNTTANRKALPQWFLNNYSNCIYVQQHFFNQEIGLEEKQIKNIPIITSVPERAVLEMLSLIPQSFTYEHGYEITQSLRLLRPDILQQMLEQCRIIQVKRLFLYFADVAQLPCFDKLELNRITLGCGKRKIAQGGKYIAKYQLSVPHLLDEIEEEAIASV